MLEVQTSNGWMLSLAGFRARTLASQASAQASKGQGQDFGRNTPASFVSYDPDTCVWRTSQASFMEDLDVFLGTWPHAGTMRNGRCYPLQPLVRHTKEAGYFLLPSPVASLADVASSLTASMQFRETKNGVPRKVSNQGVDGSVGLSRLVQLWTGQDIAPAFVEWMMGYPPKYTALED